MLSTQLSVATYVARTTCLGPGARFALWVQGCPFACPACTAPEFTPSIGGETIEARDLTEIIGSVEGITGVTISGGEPFAQVAGLSALLPALQEQGLSVLVFSGFSYGYLQRRARADRDFARALSAIDVLIDGLYEHNLNDSRGLRGSSNQQVHFLTERYRDQKAELEMGPRLLEVAPSTLGDLLVGVLSLKAWRDVMLGQH